ncbi:YncE family protein [Acetobacterium wieringae]|uniref:YncE family protein n=1 Tax=Acetobacterium wieringae TaxID=52694 RepID=UPI0020337958|nr:hypothetical protein [Acetobacterium wieringae]URN83479.1 hypothetical protein CHL1_002616 [Acetobacterium wieringae]
MGGSFNGFLKPKPDKRSNGKKYGAGDKISIKDLKLPVVPTVGLSSATTSYEYSDIKFDGDYMYDIVRYSSTAYVRKHLKSVDSRGYDSFSQVLAPSFSLSPSTIGPIVIKKDSQYIYCAMSNFIVKLDKATLTEVKRYTAGYYIVDMRLSKDGTYISALYNDSSNGTSISLRKLDLDLNLIAALTNLPSFNFSDTFIDDRLVYCYGYYAGNNCIIDTLTMTRYEINALFYDNTDYFPAMRSFVENGYWFYMNQGGILYKIVYDDVSFAFSVVAQIDIWSDVTYMFFNYDKDNIFLYQTSVGGNKTNVLIDKKTLSSITLAPFSFITSPDNSDINFFSNEINEYIFRNTSTGTVYKTCFNMEIR